MALTRAQLLMGDGGEGTVLLGQAQGVRPGGNGITLRPDGVIEVNSQTIVGVMRLGQTASAASTAFNGYTWPNSAGGSRKQLTTDGTGILSWEDADHIPWSAKGQLIVGTGAETDTLLNVGRNTSLLIADSFTASGLNYTDAVTTAMQAPAGTTLDRPTGVNGPFAGQIRYNIDTQKFEFYSPAGWQEIASGNPIPGGNTFVKETIPVSPLEKGSAVIPAGTSGERQTAPPLTAGEFRFNTTLGQLEVWTGGGWAQVPASGASDFVLQSRPPAGISPSAIIPAGTTAEADPAASGGWLRFNIDTSLMEVFNGTIWVPVGAPPNAGLGLNLSGVVPNEILKAEMFVGTAPPPIGTLVNEAIDGSMYWNSTLERLFILYNDGFTTNWVPAAPVDAVSPIFVDATGPYSIYLDISALPLLP